MPCGIRFTLVVITDIHYQLSYFQLVDNDLRIIFILAEQPSSLRKHGSFSDAESSFFVFFSLNIFSPASFYLRFEVNQAKAENVSLPGLPRTRNLFPHHAVI